MYTRRRKRCKQLDDAYDCVAHGFYQYGAALDLVKTLACEENIITAVIGLGQPQNAFFADDGGTGFAIGNAFNAAAAEFNSCVFQSSIHLYLQNLQTIDLHPYFLQYDKKVQMQIIEFVFITVWCIINCTGQKLDKLYANRLHKQ